MSEPPIIPPHLSFHHEAMMTTFTLRICGKDEGLLRSIACECFGLIDELERKLSRYNEGGDVARINAMAAGETLHISEECHDALLISMEACVRTGGLFDPTLGTLIEHQKSELDGELPQPTGTLVIHPDSAMVYCETPGRVIDLGGIGKGYTLDCLGEFLNGWDVESALLSAGASTHLAMGSETWPIDLAGDHHQQCIQLKNESLSASGTSIQGAHIVHPKLEQSPGHASQPPEQPTRIWAISPTAALADAWSTALMLVPQEELKSALTKESMLTTIYTEQKTNFLRINQYEVETCSLRRPPADQQKP